MVQDACPDAPSVLYVEDSDHSIRLVEEAFREVDAHAHLTVRNDGETALQYLREHSEASLVVLLDLNLVGLHGLEVLKRIRNDPALADLPVVVFTNSNHDADRERAMQLGATAYREKPNSFDEYVAVVEELLSGPGR